MLMFLYSFMAVGGVLITGYLVARTLFLSQLPTSAIPLKFLLPALVMMMVVTPYSKIAPRYRTDRVALVSTLLSAAGVLIFWGLLRQWRENLTLLCALFVYIQLISALTMIQFWNLAGELFDARQAKRLFGLISSGGTLASMGFGAGLSWLASRVDVANLLFLIVLALATCALCAGTLGRRYAGSFRAAPDGDSDKPTLSALSRTPLLLSLTVLVVVMTMVTNLTDYQFDLALQQRFGQDPGSMLIFLGRLSLWTGLGAAFFQFVLAGSILEKLGLRAALLLLPLGMGLGSFAVLVSGGLFWAVLAPRVVDLVLKYTLNQTAQNLLYLPVKSRLRRQAKVVLDGIVNPATVCFLGLTFLLVDQFGSFEVVYWSIPVLALVVVWLVTVIRASRQYVETLSRTISLRDFSPDQEVLNLADGSTVGVLARTLESRDPMQVVHALGLLPQLPEVDWSRHLHPLFEHHQAEVRGQAATVVRELKLSHLVDRVGLLLEDDEESVRMLAVDCLCALEGSTAVDRVKPLLSCASLRVRGAAVAGLVRYGGLDGILQAAEHLKQMVTSSLPEERLVGARVLGRLETRSYFEPLVPLFQDPCAEVRAASVEAAGALAAEALVPHLLPLLADDRLRGLTVEALKRCAGETHPALHHEIRRADLSEPEKVALVKIVSHHPTPEDVTLLWDQLLQSQGPYQGEVCRALLKMRSRGVDLPQQGLQEILDQDVARLYKLCSYLSDQDDLLAEAVRVRVRQGHERLLGLLCLCHPEIPLTSLQAALFRDDERLRAYAVELLDNLIGGSDKDLLLPLFGNDEAGLRRLARSRLAVESRPREAEVEELGSWGDPWLRVCALHLSEAVTPFLLESLSSGLLLERETAWMRLRELEAPSDFEQRLEKLGNGGLRGSPYLERLSGRQKGNGLMPLSNIEELIFLRSVPLFAELTGEEVAGIVPITHEVHFQQGDSLIAQGEEGHCLYVVVSGTVEVTIDGEPVSNLGPRDTLGELAVLSEQPRSANCRALSEVVALRLDKSDFWELMGERPEIAKGVIKVLMRYVKGL